MRKKQIIGISVVVAIVVLAIASWCIVHRPQSGHGVLQSDPSSGTTKMQEDAEPEITAQMERKISKRLTEEKEVGTEQGNDEESVAQQAGVRKEMKALREAYAKKRGISDEELLDLWDKALATATKAGLDSKSKADSIWALAGTGMLLVDKGIMSRDEVEAQCGFLIKLGKDSNEALIVRRMAISAMGDLEMTSAVPVMEELLTDEDNWNVPEVARSACIALTKLDQEKASTTVGTVLSNTTNSGVFGSAAYALGTVGTPDVLPALVENRMRLGDNLSVDNALNSMSNVIIEAISDPSHPQIVSAIQATRALWQEEQKRTYVPLLNKLVEENGNPEAVQRAAAKRLLEHASSLPLEAEKKHLRQMLAAIENKAIFEDEQAYIQKRLKAEILAPAKITKREDI